MSIYIWYVAENRDFKIKRKVEKLRPKANTHKKTDGKPFPGRRGEEEGEKLGGIG